MYWLSEVEKTLSPISTGVTSNMRDKSSHPLNTYMWMKATHHDQPELADQILRAEFPYEAKQLGDEINENLDTWDDMKVQVMTHVLNMKYMQCAQFRDALHHSHEKILAEATNNMFWASGLNPQQTIKTDRKDWPGQNALGCLLMALRSSQLRYSSPKQPTDPPATDVAVALLDRAIDPRSGVLSSPELLSQADDVIKQLITNKHEKQLHDTPTTARPSLLTSSQMKRKDISPLPDEIQKRTKDSPYTMRGFFKAISPKSDT